MLGRVVEVVGKQSFDTFVVSRILRPIGMNDTSFWVEGDARALTSWSAPARAAT